MKLIFILLLALMVPVQSYANSQSHDSHNAIYKGSANKLFTPLGSELQQTLSTKHSLEHSGLNVDLIERVQWVNINMAELDALRVYAVDILSRAEQNPDLETDTFKNYEGQSTSLRIKNHLEYPIDINFNFFDDVQFANRYLAGMTQTLTPDGKVYYTITLSHQIPSMPAINIMLKDKLRIYAKTWSTYVRLEQVDEQGFRIYQTRKAQLNEGPIKTPSNHSEQPKEGKEITPKKSDIPAPALSSTKRTIDVLILYDTHTNLSRGQDSTVNPGVILLNRILSNSGINAKINIIAYNKLPASVCGGGSSECYSSYPNHLDEITASKDILELRLKYGADAAVVLRSTKHGDLNYQTAGIANLTNPSDPYQAEKTYALLYFAAEEEPFAHEIGHILGADHSAYNDLPGTPPAVAYLGFYDDKQNMPYHKDAIKTLMTYDYLCADELNKVNANNPGKSLQKCILAEQFSGPDPYPAPWSNSTVMIGSNTVANRFRVDDVTFRAHGWNQEIINHKPEPAIRFVDVPLVTGYPHCFNAVGSTDPDGDRLVRFYWFITKYGDYNKIKEAEYGTKESTFCWTPTHAQRGDYHVSLSVRDENGADKIIGKTLHIVYDPDYISAPELYLHEVGSSDITLSWSTPTNGSVGYYAIEKKVGDGLYLSLANSWDTMEDISFDKLSQGDNYFRVRGCKLFSGCGAWSNVLYYNHRHISLNTQ